MKELAAVIFNTRCIYLFDLSLQVIIKSLLSTDSLFSIACPSHPAQGLTPLASCPFYRDTSLPQLGLWLPILVHTYLPTSQTTLHPCPWLHVDTILIPFNFYTFGVTWTPSSLWLSLESLFYATTIHPFLLANVDGHFALAPQWL